VVLSACQTALGADVRGEGLIGLTRAFMYAGAPRVVSSLWSVSDRATAALMKAFYRRLLIDRMSVAAALRGAQLELRRNPRWSHPYYWAAFVVQGEPL
jgi:CHAT domain-containing protein